jgi:GPH family glycoside/pentoside/hexuronide:cation symporter
MAVARAQDQAGPDGPARVRFPELLGYAVGSLGAGVYSTVPGILLLYYMTQVLALPVALASLAILLPKLVIMVVEPMVGAWSDRVFASSGSRRPFLIAGAVLSAAAFVLLFSTPKLPEPVVTCAVVSGAYLLASLAYSLFAVPYVAMPATMSEGERERAKIMGWRMSFVFAGVLLGAAVPPILVGRFGGGAVGYTRMAMVIAGLSLLCMLISAGAARRGRRPPRNARRTQRRSARRARLTTVLPRPF